MHKQGRYFCVEKDFPNPDITSAFCDLHHLTPHEHQILSAVCLGKMNSQIGRELGISDATVRLHMGHIHRKLKTSSKVDLVLRLWQWSCNSEGGRNAIAPR